MTTLRYGGQLVRLAPRAQVSSEIDNECIQLALAQGKQSVINGNNDVYVTYVFENRRFFQTVVARGQLKTVWRQHPEHTARAVQLSPFVYPLKPIMTSAVTVRLVMERNGHEWLIVQVYAYDGEIPPHEWQAAANSHERERRQRYWKHNAYQVTPALADRLGVLLDVTL